MVLAGRLAWKLRAGIDPIRTAEFLASYGVPVADDDSPVIAAKPRCPDPLPKRWIRYHFGANRAGRSRPSAASGSPVLVGFGTTEIGDRSEYSLASGISNSWRRSPCANSRRILSGRNCMKFLCGLSASTAITSTRAIAAFRKLARYGCIHALLAVMRLPFTRSLCLFLFSELEFSRRAP